MRTKQRIVQVLPRLAQPQPIIAARRFLRDQHVGGRLDQLGVPPGPPTPASAVEVDLAQSIIREWACTSAVSASVAIRDRMSATGSMRWIKAADVPAYSGPASQSPSIDCQGVDML